MDREKLIRVVLESEKELYLEDIRRLQEKDYPDSFFLTELGTIVEDIDWSIGSPASKCFEENEVLGNIDNHECTLARVENEDYTLPNLSKIYYYSSRFKLNKDSQILHPVNRVELCGSELTTIFPPSIPLIALKNNSKVNLNLIKKSKFGRVFLHNITVQGNNCEILMEAKVKDNTITEDFRIIVEGSDNKIDVDLRKLAIGHFKLFFNSSGSNNYVNTKVGKKTDVLVNFWSNETEGVKVIIEGGRNVNVDDLVNNNVEYEIR